jgi:hypothetical protein
MTDCKATETSTSTNTTDHEYSHWREYMTSSYEQAVAAAHGKGTVYITASSGAGEVFFRIRMSPTSPNMIFEEPCLTKTIEVYCYVAEALLVLFWCVTALAPPNDLLFADGEFRAFHLTYSVYGWAKSPRLRRIFLRVDIVGKVTAIVLPIIESGLLELPALQKSFVGYIIVCNFLCSCSRHASLWNLPLTKISWFELPGRVCVLADDTMEISLVTAATQVIEPWIWQTASQRVR